MLESFQAMTLLRWNTSEDECDYENVKADEVVDGYADYNTI